MSPTKTAHIALSASQTPPPDEAGVLGCVPAVSVANDNAPVIVTAAPVEQAPQPRAGFRRSVVITTLVASICLHLGVALALVFWHVGPQPEGAVVPVEIALEQEAAPERQQVAAAEPETTPPPEQNAPTPPEAVETPPPPPEPAAEAPPPPVKQALPTPPVVQKPRPQPEKKERPRKEARPERAVSQEARASSGAASEASARMTSLPADYRALVRAALARSQRYPAGAEARRASGTARVQFVIQRSGSVSQVALVGSSGDADIDRAALDMVRRAAPFPPLPREFARNSEAFTVPARFGLRN